MGMLTKNFSQSKRLVAKVLDQDQRVIRGNLRPVVTASLQHRQRILALTKKCQTPFYLFDHAAAERSIKAFKSVFTSAIPGLEIFYAVKSNPHQYLLQLAVKHRLGLDVSSGRELQLAVKSGAKKIVFSGPAKTTAELAMAIKYRRQLVIHLDSFTELRRLAALLQQRNQTVRAGIRVYTKYHDTWNKFGIPLPELARFFALAKRYPRVELQGLQCHMSWVKGPATYQKMLQAIATAVGSLSAADRRRIKFVDFGGGFEPYRLEGYCPWTLPQGEIIKPAAEALGRPVPFTDKYYLSESVPLEAYARGIAPAIKKYLRPLVECVYYCEPGRAISSQSMHLILQVMDVKNPKLVILDGGTNMVGYEVFEFFYYPVINLTHPAKREISCHLYGSLCTPYDLFGFYWYASKMQAGDIIMIPNQGAYTYTLAQNFIKPIPPVHILK